MKKIVLSVMALVTGFFLVACGAGTVNDAEESTVIRLASSPGPYSELFMKEVAPRLEELGYTVEDNSFSDLLSADLAVKEGQADLNVDQHLLYMNNFNKESDADLVSLGEIPTVPTAIFPGRKSSLEEIEADNTVGVPEDPSNLTRALLLLEKEGLILLADDVEPINLTEDDVVENFKNIDIIPMDSSTIPRSLDDLDYAIIPGSIAYDAGISFGDALAYEDVLPELMLQAVVPADKKDAPWTQDVVSIYSSEEFKSLVQGLNDDRGETYWIIPD